MPPLPQPICLTLAKLVFRAIQTFELPKPIVKIIASEKFVQFLNDLILNETGFECFIYSL